MIQQAYKRPMLATRPGFVGRNLKKSWPFGVWLGAVGICVWLYFGYGQFSGITGVVQGHVLLVAPLRTARLLSVEVEVGQRVKAGDLLARMDASLLDAELAVDDARIREAEMTAAGFQQNMLELWMRVAAEQAAAEAELEERRIRHGQDQALLQALREEQVHREALFERQLIPVQEARELLPQLAALQVAMDAFPAVEEMYETRWASARAESEEMRRILQIQSGESLSDALDRKTSARRAILEASRAARWLEKETYGLRAPHDAMVSRISQVPGVVVEGGQEVVRLVSEAVDTVEGFLPEAHLAGMREGESVRVVRPHVRSGFDAVVVSISPEVQALPERISPILNQPLRGRRVFLTIPNPPDDLIPGETVFIRPLRPRLFSFARESGS